MQEKLFIKNNRGLKLAAILHRPESKSRQKFPAVIVLHGFTGYKEEEHVAGLSSDLEKNGFVAIRFDASGFGESEGTLSQDYLFSNYLQDTECVYKFLRSQEYIDKNRIGVVGHSWGGKMCVIFGAKHSELRAIVPIQAPNKLRYSNGTKALIAIWKDKYWREKVSSKYGKIRVPFGIITDDDKFDTVNAAREIKSPILFILGKKDDVIPQKDIRMAFQMVSGPKRLWEADVGHYYKKYSDEIKIINFEVVKFFKENLKEKKGESVHT